MSFISRHVPTNTYGIIAISIQTVKSSYFLNSSAESAETGFVSLKFSKISHPDLRNRCFCFCEREAKFKTFSGRLGSNQQHLSLFFSPPLPHNERLR